MGFGLSWGLPAAARQVPSFNMSFQREAAAHLGREGQQSNTHHAAGTQPWSRSRASVQGKQVSDIPHDLAQACFGLLKLSFPLQGTFFWRSHDALQVFSTSVTTMYYLQVERCRDTTQSPKQASSCSPPAGYGLTCSF